MAIAPLSAANPFKMILLSTQAVLGRKGVDVHGPYRFKKGQVNKRGQTENKDFEASWIDVGMQRQHHMGGP